MSSMHPTDPRKTSASTQTAAGVQRPDQHGPEMDDEQVAATGELSEEMDPVRPADDKD